MIPNSKYYWMLSDKHRNEIQNILLRSKRKHDYESSMFGTVVDADIDYPLQLRHLHEWRIHSFTLYSEDKDIFAYFTTMKMQALEDDKLWLITKEDWTNNKLYIPLFDYKELI